MRYFVVIGALFGLLWAPVVADAQRDSMKMGESLGGAVTRATSPAPAEAFSIDIVRSVGGGTVEQITGGDPQKLAPQIAGALGFLLRWGAGPSTAPPGSFNANTSLVLPESAGPLTVKDAQLLLPVRGLSRNTDGTVSVRRMAVRTKDRVVAGTAVLVVDAQGIVSRVTLTK